jgi:serine/threonine-protein kinase RsbW
MLIDSDKVTLQFSSQPDNFKLLYPLLEQFQKQYAISDEVAANVELVVGEAINNAITHGNKGDVSKLVNVEAEVDAENHLVVKVRDEGGGFDYNKVADPTLPENIECPTGRGVFLMKQLADMVIFSDNGSTVEMQFKL